VRHIALIVALIVGASVGSTARQIDAGRLAVLVATRTLQPGAVTVVTMRASQPLATIDGKAFQRPVRFWPTTQALEWQGLVAPNLEAKPGTYQIVVRGMGADGSVVSGQASVIVLAKRFETRRLTVEPQFVNPPAAEAERIARDAKLLASVFSKMTDRIWRGPFELPVSAEATSSFGRLTVLNGESRGRHQGADFRASSGSPVRAPNAGRVAIAEDLYFSGNTVVLDHGLGMFSLLAHLSRIDVNLGASVARGDLLGQSGATGRVTGPHLHWALRLGEFSVDPLSLVAALSTQTESSPSFSR